MVTQEKKKDLRQKIQDFGPWVKWLVRREIEEAKATSAYIDMLCPSTNSSKVEDSPVAKLEKLVKSTIIKEFGPSIVDNKSFNLLVDAVMHKIQRESMDKIQ